MDMLWSSMPCYISYSSLLRCCFHRQQRICRQQTFQAICCSTASITWIVAFTQWILYCWWSFSSRSEDGPFRVKSASANWGLLVTAKSAFIFFTKGLISLPLIHLFNKSWLRASLYAPLVPSPNFCNSMFY